MSTLSKYQLLKATLKITKRSSDIFSSEFTPRKIQRPHPTPRQENFFQNAQSLQIHGRFAQKSAETLWPTKISPSKTQAKTPHSMRRTSQQKTPHHKETSQLIFNANQLGALHKRQAPIKNVFPNRQSSNLQSLNQLSQITDGSKNDM